MTEKQFNAMLESRIDSIKSTLSKKSKEYSANGDKLYNFKRAAEVGRTTPSKALFGMLMKHIVSVLDMIESENDPTVYMVNEKIGDTINYLILLEAIFKEGIYDSN